MIVWLLIVWSCFNKSWPYAARDISPHSCPCIFLLYLHWQCCKLDGGACACAQAFILKLKIGLVALQSIEIEGKVQKQIQTQSIRRRRGEKTRSPLKIAHKSHAITNRIDLFIYSRAIQKFESREKLVMLHGSMANANSMRREMEKTWNSSSSAVCECVTLLVLVDRFCSYLRWWSARSPWLFAVNWMCEWIE